MALFLMAGSCCGVAARGAESLGLYRVSGERGFVRIGEARKPGPQVFSKPQELQQGKDDEFVFLSGNVTSLKCRWEVMQEWRKT